MKFENCGFIIKIQARKKRNLATDHFSLLCVSLYICKATPHPHPQYSALILWNPHPTSILTIPSANWNVSFIHNLALKYQLGVKGGGRNPLLKLPIDIIAKYDSTWPNAHPKHK